MKVVKNIFSAYVKFPLVLKILIGMAIGVLLGIFVPAIDIIAVLGTAAQIVAVPCGAAVVISNHAADITVVTADRAGVVAVGDHGG